MRLTSNLLIALKLICTRFDRLLVGSVAPHNNFHFTAVQTEGISENRWHPCVAQIYCTHIGSPWFSKCKFCEMLGKLGFWSHKIGQLTMGCYLAVSRWLIHLCVHVACTWWQVTMVTSHASPWLQVTRRHGATYLINNSIDAFGCTNLGCSQVLRKTSFIYTYTTYWRCQQIKVDNVVGYLHGSAE